MQVHRRTVLYRIRLIEELTGQDVSETSDRATPGWPCRPATSPAGGIRDLARAESRIGRPLAQRLLAANERVVYVPAKLTPR